MYNYLIKIHNNHFKLYYLYLIYIIDYYIIIYINLNQLIIKSLINF